MNKDRYTECTFLIPVCGDTDLSEGELHSPFIEVWLQDELFRLFGGATTAPGEYEGFYMDPDSGHRIADKSHKFIVAVSEEKIDDLRQLLSETCLVFKQKCIYLSIAGQVEFIEPPAS